MNSEYEKNDVVFYSATLSEFEQLDFKNDALAGVRANYFNSDCQLQMAETEIFIDNFNYNLSYKLEKNQPLSWKITRNNRPYQSAKRKTGGIYSVLYYAENGVVYKQQYFDQNHFWIKTEYFNPKISDELVCEIFPKKLDNIIVIEKNIIKNKVITSKSVLFPSESTPKRMPQALVYTSRGMIWYDSEFKPENQENLSIKEDNQKVNFELDEKMFAPDYMAENPLDFSKLEYLHSDEKNEDHKVKNNTQSENKYSAYDEIEKILTEAQKTNKDLLGDAAKLNEISEQNQNSETENTYQPTPLNMPEDDFELQNIISEEDDTNIISADEEFDDLESSEISENSESYESYESENPYYVALHAAKENKDEYETENNEEIEEENKNTDKNDFAVDRQRTLLDNGFTAYDGEFKDGKRNGFGVFYYKNGNINYVGNWLENRRNGAGVGYRTSDGTMHIGKWADNTPVEYGARFDKDGNFIDLAFYNDGLKNGKCVCFDKDGNIVVSLWKDGEKISESVINIQE